MKTSIKTFLALVLTVSSTAAVARTVKTIDFARVMTDDNTVRKPVLDGALAPPLLVLPFTQHLEPKWRFHRHRKGVFG